MADRAALRARRRQLMTGETYQQARDHLGGDDGVPDADHPDQADLEAAVLAELDDVHGGLHPVGRSVYKIARVHPTPAGLTITPAPGFATAVLDDLLPEADADLPFPLTVAGIPGLRVAADRPGRIRLYRPGISAAVTVELHDADVEEVRDWIAELPGAGDPMRTAADWTDRERAQQLPHGSWVGDATSRSRLLRRLLAFAPLPAPALIGPDQEAPTLVDIAELLDARQRPARVPAPATGPAPAPIATGGDRPALVAVLSGRGGGRGRSTVAARLAAAFTAAGRRTMICSTDPHGYRPVPIAPGVAYVMRESDRAGLADYARAQARAADCALVLVDAGPHGQLEIAAAADAWIGVVPLWVPPGPHNRALTELAVAADGRALPEGWEDDWLGAMRTHHWQVAMRTELSNPQHHFAPFDAAQCAAVLLCGGDTRTASTVRAQLAPRYPVAEPIPYDRDPTDPAESVTHAYAALAAALTA